MLFSLTESDTVSSRSSILAGRTRLHVSPTGTEQGYKIAVQGKQRKHRVLLRGRHMREIHRSNRSVQKANKRADGACGRRIAIVEVAYP